MFNSVLVICTGNICRSPLGERLLQKLLPDKQIHSAGVQALTGHEADASAKRIAAMHDLSLDGHRARQFTSSLARKYELILAMEKFHIEKITYFSPESRGKTMLFGHWIGHHEIPDPFRKSEEAFVSVYNLIDKAGQHWAEMLSKK